MIRQIRLFAAAAALLAGSAADAAAQFTAVVAPPPPSRSAQAAVARADSASRHVGARDSANVTRLTDMKAWVDSATIAMTGQRTAAPAPTAADSVAAARAAAAPTPAAAPAPAHDATMHDGARAPDTATPLPTLALIGTGALGAGLLLMRRRRA